MSEFLAEARILVRPDTTKFQALLEAELAAAIKPISVPIVPVVAAANGTAAASVAAQAAAAQQEVAVAAQAAGAAAETAATSTVRLTAAQKASAAAAQKLAFAQTEVIGADTAVAAARTTLTRSTAAVAAAEKAVQVALTGTDAALVASTQETLALAAAQQLQAKTALANAKANAAQAGSLSQLTRGAGASGLSLFGLRGATLAASGAFLAGTAAVVGFSKAIQSAASLETELNVFRVTAGATADEMDRVSEAAKDLGRDITLPGVSANDAAVALTELSKAGLSVQDSLDGAKGVLQLATAAQIDFVDASKAVAGALNAFGLAGSDAVKVADLLAGAAKESQGEISDFNTALGQTALVADKFGLSMGDTVTILTELAQAGLLGGRAGTSLRVAILNLVSPSSAAAKALEKLKVQVLDIDGNFRPQIFTDIAQALKTYSVEQRNATLRTIFGTDSIKTYLAVASKGPAAFKQISDAVNEAGLAQELAGARTQGFQGDVENLANQVETLGLNIGQVAKGPIGLLVRGLGAATGAVNDFTAAAEKKGFFEEFGKAISDFASSAERLGIGFNRAVIASTHTSDSFTIFEGVAKTATDAANDLADALGRVASAAQVQQPADAGLGIKQIRNIIAGFDDKAVRDKIAKDDGQLLDDLRAEQDFLNRQLQRQFVKNRPELRRLIEQALLGAVNEIDAVQAKSAAAAGKVKQKGQKVASDIAGALLSAQSVARDQLQNQIDQDAQKGFLGKQITDEKSLKALVLQQIAAVKDRISVEGGRAAALVALRKVLNDVDGQVTALREQQRQQQKALQDSILETQLLRAQGTPGTEDDTRVLNKQIAAAQKDLNAQKAIADNEKLGSKVRLEAALKVQEDVRKILTIRQSIKSLSGGGFSLSDLFKEAINQLNEFGSNVSTSPITPGGARAAVAGGILGQKTGLTDAEKASLNATAATNDLLAQILVAIGPPPNQAQGSPKKVFLVRESGGPEIGVATSKQQRALGTFVGGV